MWGEAGGLVKKYIFIYSSTYISAYSLKLNILFFNFFFFFFLQLFSFVNKPFVIMFQILSYPFLYTFK